MNPMTDLFRQDNKRPLLFRQLSKPRLMYGLAVRAPRGERMQGWQSRLERLFARQEY
jgi:hypothetical protein